MLVLLLLLLMMVLLELGKMNIPILSEARFDALTELILGDNHDNFQILRCLQRANIKHDYDYR